MFGPRTRRLTVALAAAAVPLAMAAVAPAQPSPAAGCPAGYQPLTAERASTSGNPRLTKALNDLDRTSGAGSLCVRVKHPESMREIALRDGQMLASEAAPAGANPAALYRAALEQRAAMIAAAPAVSGAGGGWQPAGKGPLLSNDERFGTSGTGLAEVSGRVDSLDYDPVGKRLFAALGTSGVWMSTDLGKNWTSISDSLPAPVVGAVAWTPADGGALLVISGEPLMAGLSRTGVGAFRTTDLGRTWQKARGVPDGALSFRVAVDNSSPNIAYAATSKGLFRTDDAGKSYTNVALPTDECTGKTDNDRCIFANIVTDVVVQEPGGTTDADGGKVLAVIGYRAGARPFPQNSKLKEGPWNGLYASDTGRPGTFKRLDGDGFAPQNRIGRTEFGAAVGPEQNHDIVYAIVQDAILFRGGPPTIDVPEEAWPGAMTTVINGIYVSEDFGATWSEMANTEQIAYNPTTGTTLQGPLAAASLYNPGAQAWYNQWISPDPTRQDDNGVPTRLLFGLEEVWQNEFTDQAQNGRSSFKVIGRYFAGESCMFISTGLPFCPTGRPALGALTTTHPDQHAVEFIPDGQGGVTLVVGNDGGIYTQHAAAGDAEFNQEDWGLGSNDGFYTLLPYHARAAKDGKIWFGLQDNGTAFIDPATGKQYMAFGGDGFYVAVDPNDSNIAWGETPGGSMRSTSDGGVTWREQTPPISAGQFSNPFVMDPTDANHLMTAGPEVVETEKGVNTCTSIDAPGGLASQTLSCSWFEVFHLGTSERPGQGPPDDPLEDYPGAVHRATATELRGDSAYIGYCGPCSVMNTSTVYGSGIATNVGGTEAPERMTSKGWHIADAVGLPERQVSEIVMDPSDPKTIYVALGGYENREWRPPGSFGDKNTKIGRGNVWKSTDAGKTFTSISGNLPDTPAYAIELRGSQVIVATKVGVFMSRDQNGSTWAALDKGLPAVPVLSVQLKPGDPNTLIAATFGRGVQAYRFSTSGGTNPVTKPRTVVRGVRLPATGFGGAFPAVAMLAMSSALTVRMRRRRG